MLVSKFIEKLNFLKQDVRGHQFEIREQQQLGEELWGCLLAKRRF
jgi:hypothetical protein